MTLYTALSDVPAGYGPSVVTIGNFDGVHRGHARVISRVVSLAEEHGLRSIAVSFDPHPIQVHRPEVAHHDIMSQGARRHYMCLLGLEDYLLLHYSLEFAQQTPEEFVKTTFVDGLNARYVVIGDDVRFGRNNSGDLNTMRELGEKYGFEVVVVEDLMWMRTPAAPRHASASCCWRATCGSCGSSRLRRCLRNGVTTRCCGSDRHLA